MKGECQATQADRAHDEATIREICDNPSTSDRHHAGDRENGGTLRLHGRPV